MNLPDNYCFETEDSDEMEMDKSCLLSNDGDLLPFPQELGVTRYLYIAFIWLPLSARRKGLATQLIEAYCDSHPKDSVYIELCKSDNKRNPLNGLVLESKLTEIGFKVEYRLPHRVGMLLKR